MRTRPSVGLPRTGFDRGDKKMGVAKLEHSSLPTSLSSWEEGLEDLSSFHQEMEVSGTLLVRAG